MRLSICSFFFLLPLIAYTQGQITLTMNPTSCATCCDGSVEVLVDGCWYGALKYAWTGGGLMGSDNQLSNVCNGSFSFYLTDEDAQTTAVAFDMTTGTTSYNVVENVLLDCLPGGNLSDCIVYYFPGDSLTGGEACITAPPCWTTPFLYEWIGPQGLVSTSACISNAPPGTYTVNIQDADNDMITTEVTLNSNSDFGALYFEACATEIWEAQEFELNVYPIPSSDFLSINLSQVWPNSSIILYDLQGKHVINSNVQSERMLIDIRHLDGGIYFLQLCGSDATVLCTEKVIVH